MADVTVKLSRTYEAHGQSFNTVTLREPNGADLDAIGEIWNVQTSPAGERMVFTIDENIIAYRARLIVDKGSVPSEADMGQLSLRDAMAVRDAVVGFFTQARRDLYGEAKTS